MKAAEGGHYAQLVQIGYNGYINYQNDFLKLHDLYKGKMDPEVYESLSARRKSSIVVNKAYALVQRVKASTEQAYFTNERFASFNPLTAYEEAAADELQKAFDYYWSKVMSPYLSMSKVWLEGYIYGTPITKVYWSGGRPVIENVNIHDVYFDPSARDFGDCRFVVNNIYMTQEDVGALKKSGVYNKRFKLSEIQPNNKGVAGQFQFAHESQTVETYGRIMLQDVYEKIGSKWYVTTTYNELILLRERHELKDGCPIFAGKTVPNTHSVYENYNPVGSYSDSLLAPVYDLQIELNVRVNQEIDAIAENINPSYIAERGSGLNEVDLRKGPSKVVYVNDINTLKDMKAPPLQHLQMNEERIRTDIEEITGIQMLGSADTSAIVNRQTAEGMNILTAEKSLRTDNYIRTLNDTHTKPMINHIAKLIWKYCDIPDFFQGIDRSKEYKFAVDVSAGLGATSKQVQLNGLSAAFEKFMALGDSEHARQTIMDSLPLLGFKNTAEYQVPMTRTEKKAAKEQKQKAGQAKQKEMEAMEKRKINAEIAKVENEASMTLVEAAKIQSEAQDNKEMEETKSRVELEKIAAENRRLDIEEQKLYLSMKEQDDDGTE